MATTKTIALDLYNTNIVTVNAKQYDNQSRTVEIVCTDHGKKVTLNPSTMKAFIRCTKSNNEPYVDKVGITSEGTLNLVLTSDILGVQGRHYADIVICDGSGTIKDGIEILAENILSTMSFYLLVSHAAVSGSQVTANTELSALFAELNDLKTRINAILSELENANSIINVIDNLNTDMSGQGALDAHQGYILDSKKFDIQHDEVEKNNKIVATNNLGTVEVSQYDVHLLEFIAEQMSILAGLTPGKLVTVDADRNLTTGEIDYDDITENAVQKAGDTMTGDLTLPNILVTGKVKMGDASMTYDTNEEAIVFSFFEDKETGTDGIVYPYAEGVKF